MRLQRIVEKLRMWSGWSYRKWLLIEFGRFLFFCASQSQPLTNTRFGPGQSSESVSGYSGSCRSAPEKRTGLCKGYVGWKYLAQRIRPRRSRRKNWWSYITFLRGRRNGPILRVGPQYYLVRRFSCSCCYMHVPEWAKDKSGWYSHVIVLFLHY